MNRGETNDRPEPEHNWTSFGMCFVGMFPYIPHDEAPPNCAWKVGADYDTMDLDFRRAEAPYRAEIETIVRTLCATDNAEMGSPESAYFLGLRGAVLGPWFLSLSVPLPGTGATHTIVPFPKMPMMRVLEWFLIDWWNHHGPKFACEIRILETALSSE